MILPVIKWIVFPFFILLVVLTLTGRKTFKVELIIPSTPEHVWSVLMDTKAYEHWNPVFRKVEGTYRLGETIKNTVYDPKGNILKISATEKTLNKQRILRQTGGLLGFLTFDHQWILEPVENGVKVTQLETDQGFYMWFWDSSWIEPSYDKVNKALYNRVIKLKK